MSPSFVTVESYQFLPQAEAARMAMESEGINAILADKETVSTDWALGNAIGYIKLQVPPEQVDAALGILAKMRQQRDARLASRGTGDLGECLSCGAPFPSSQSTCPQCGWSFEEADENEASGDRVSPDSGLEQDVEGGAVVTESLLAWKQPLVLMLLIPVIAAFAAFTLFFLDWLLRSFV